MWFSRRGFRPPVRLFRRKNGFKSSLTVVQPPTRKTTATSGCFLGRDRSEKSPTSTRIVACRLSTSATCDPLALGGGDTLVPDTVCAVGNCGERAVDTSLALRRHRPCGWKSCFGTTLRKCKFKGKGARALIGRSAFGGTINTQQIASKICISQELNMALIFM